jgi:phosphohistidine phosphatase
MQLWIIRHGHAVSGGADASRELSARGFQQAEALGRFFRHLQLEPPDEIWHSQLVRARQTAEAIRDTAAWASPTREVEGLLPSDDPTALADRFGQLARLVLVGHNPHLERLASWLIAGETEAEAFVMKTGTCICLENDFHPGGAQGPFRRWSVSWMLPPELIRTT